MSRTVKHPNSCPRPRCALCHPWKRGWVKHGGDVPASARRRMQDTYQQGDDPEA